MNIPNVTVEDVMFALDTKKISVWQEDADDSVKCQIGYLWFYFTHIEEDTCLEDFATDELAEMIANVINDGEGNGLGDGEDDYYKNIIKKKKKNKS